MELLGDVGNVESHFGLFGDSVSVHGCTKRTIGSEIVLDAPDVLLGVKAEVEARLGLFDDNSNLTQDGCMVCAKRNMGSEIILDAPDGIAR
jgi:hypothetical protein